MSTSKKLPKMINIYFSLGEKVSLHFNQSRHLASLISRRGAQRVTFKLSPKEVKVSNKEFINQTMLDLNLLTGEYKIYPKANNNLEILNAVNKIIETFSLGGVIDAKDR